jgi:hypothetical protein
MLISIPGLIGAAALLAIGLGQWVFLRQVFAKAREGMSLAESAEREAVHDKLLKVVLAVDLLVFPAVGYYVGQMMFGK